jgi:histidine triad (HIT) family protein
MQDSIFTKIIKGEIPCYKVYEDDKTFAFLDIHPTQPGHTLVVPKIQVDHFDELEDDYYDALWRTVKKVATAQKSTFGRARIGISVVGTDVPHAHVHVFPFDKSAEYHAVPDQTAEPDHEALAEVAKKLIVT